ncbi:MAG: hypothetical protein ABIF71_12590, partial [Planctomycetota bacterium]
SAARRSFKRSISLLILPLYTRAGICQYNSAIFFAIRLISNGKRGTMLRGFFTRYPALLLHSAKVLHILYMLVLVDLSK